VVSRDLAKINLIVNHRRKVSEGIGRADSNHVISAEVSSEDLGIRGVILNDNAGVFLSNKNAIIRLRGDWMNGVV
jgi:hypothetical protein